VRSIGVKGACSNKQKQKKRREKERKNNKFHKTVQVVNYNYKTAKMMLMMK